MDNPEYLHAFRYASELSKVFLFDTYRKDYPHYFENAIMEKRPATNEDYYIPPSIADKCIVVTKTKLDEVGCNRIGCYDYKKDWEICTENDLLHWIRIGDDYTLTCKRSCTDTEIDSEWTLDGTCVASNPLKKALAAMPEKVFERASRHVFHGGFNIVDGNLKMNKRYCEAYGLDFRDGECVKSTGQAVGEFFVGKTVYSAIKTANLQPLQDQPPAIPSYMIYGGKKRRRQRRSQSLEEEEELTVENDISQNVALELTQELGKEVSEQLIVNFLKHKAPKLLSKAIDKIAAKIVIKQTIVSSVQKGGVLALKSLGKTASVIFIGYALYEIVSGILDIIDPFDYLKVISNEKLEEINKELDYTYFEDGVIRPELTPEYMWEHGILIDEQTEENRIMFMTAKVREYLDALNNIPINKFRKKMERKTTTIPWIEKKKTSKWLQFVIFMIICFTLMFIQWIHVWSFCLFFAMLFYNAYI